jgi:hypothetical protein
MLPVLFSRHIPGQSYVHPLLVRLRHVRVSRKLRLRVTLPMGVPNLAPDFWLENGTDSWDRGMRLLLPDARDGEHPGLGTPRDAPILRLLPEARAHRSADRRRPRLGDQNISLERYWRRPRSATPLQQRNQPTPTSTVIRARVSNTHRESIARRAEPDAASFQTGQVGRRSSSDAD